MIAEFSYCLGRSWEDIEENLTMAQMSAYRDYFQRHPPVHLLAAAYMGYKPPSKVASLPPPSLPDLEE